MHTPSPQRKASVLRSDYGFYHEAQLAANPDLAPETEIFVTAQDALNQRIQDSDRAHAQGLRALAARDRAQVALTEAIRSFSQHLRRIVMNDTNSPLYRTYFPNGLPQFTRAPLLVLTRRVEELIAKLGNEPKPEVAEKSAMLTAALTEARSAIRACEEAALDKSRASASLLQGKQQWIASYRASHGRLMQHFSSEPRRVEMYFRRQWRRGAEDDQGIGTSETAAADAVQTTTGVTDTTTTTVETTTDGS